jgi:hypothetical protein
MPPDGERAVIGSRGFGVLEADVPGTAHPLDRVLDACECGGTGPLQPRTELADRAAFGIQRLMQRPQITPIPVTVLAIRRTHGQQVSMKRPAPVSVGLVLVLCRGSSTLVGV